jgi:hypothetical protein
VTLAGRRKEKEMPVRKVCLFLLLAVSGIHRAVAQSPLPTATGPGSNHPFEVAGTFTHVLTDGTYVDTATLNGWTASASAAVFPLVKATVEIADYYGNHTSMKSFLGGPQVGFRIYRFEPFVRGLFGVSHAPGATPFTIAAGGGINMELTDHIALRLLQMDYYRLYGGGAKNGADYLRIGFGVAYEFGSR